MVFKEDFIDPSIAFFFATLGLVLSLVSNFYCRYVTFDVTFTELEDDEKVSARDFNFRAGIWNYEDYNLYYVIGESQIFLTRFYYCVPWNSQTMIEKDTNWTAAQVFTIISVVLGGIVGFVSCFICCTSSYTSRVSANIFGLMYLLIVLCQGLTFLFFTSNACQSNSSSNSNNSATAIHANQNFTLDWDGCVRSVGANCSIASMVFYFIAAWILLASVCACSNGESGTGTGTGTGNDMDTGPRTGIGMGRRNDVDRNATHDVEGLHSPNTATSGDSGDVDNNNAGMSKGRKRQGRLDIEQ
eukprot:158854_1